MLYGAIINVFGKIKPKFSTWFPFYVIVPFITYIMLHVKT